MTKNFREFFSTAVVTTAALVMLGFYLHDRSGADGPEPRFEPNWVNWDDSAIRLGPAGAEMTIDVFVDFTCPHCLGLTSVLDSVREAFPSGASVRFQHFPLSAEGRSMEMAKALECAQNQGRFRAMYRLLASATPEERRDLPLPGLAISSGIPDLSRFEACLERPWQTFDRIVSGRRLVGELELTGTPTVWVNGRLFDRGRTFEAFLEKAASLGIDSGLKR